MKEIVLSENDNPDRKDIEERAIELLGNPPIKKEIVSEISNRRLKDIENLEIWGKCIVGKSDIPIAQFIEKLGNGDWVNQGRKYIHLGKRCPFCQKETIDDDFRKQLESFFDKEYEKELEGLKDRKEEYIIEKDNLVTILRELENQDFEDDEKLLIHQLGETINNCLETNERNIEKKISEPSKKIAIHSSDKYIGNINCIIKKRNAEISKHNNLVDNYREEREKLISDIWKLIAKENSELINRHNKKINGFKKGIQEATQKQNQYIEKQRTVEMEIREKNKNVTSVQPAVDEINGILHNYGFNNFSIYPSEEKKNHYQIKRPDGTLAESTLSEGEATFITFLYFLQWIKGSQNEETVTEDRIIVIDSLSE